MNMAYSALGGASKGTPTPGTGMFSGLSSSGSLGAMQAGTSAVGMFSSLAAGNDKKMAYDQAAGDAEIEAHGAMAQGASQVAGLRTQLQQTLGARTVQAGAGGVDVGQGAAATQRGTLAGRVASQTGIDLVGANLNSTKYQINALNDRLMGEQAKLQGQASAIGSGVGLGLQLLML